MSKSEISSIVMMLLLSITMILASSVKANLWSSSINLTKSPEVEARPSISGDGGKIAFQRYDGEYWELCG